MTGLVRIAQGTEDRERCFEIRLEVFVDEQKVPVPLEIDELEEVCTHFLAYDDERAPPVGTARLYVGDDGQAKVQRVAVRKSVRGRGFGGALMDAVEAEAMRRGHAEAHLSAQLQAMPFYERLGYVPYGDVYDDAGIPHRMMKKPLPRGTDP